MPYIVSAVSTWPALTSMSPKFRKNPSKLCGAIHEFHLRLGDDSEVQLRGRITRTYEELQRDGTKLYVTGVQFVDDDAEDEAGEIIERIR